MTMPKRSIAVTLVLLVACGAPPPDRPSLRPATSDDPPKQTTRVADIQDAMLPVLPNLQFEFHGRFAGGPIWARLTPRRPDLQDQRVLMLLYQPPAEEQIADTQLRDHPWLLLDDQLRLRFWDERSTLSRAQYRADREPPGYVIAREVMKDEGAESWNEEVIDPLHPASTPAWELRSAPIMLALAWRAGSRGEVPVIDLFGPRRGEDLLLRWHDHHVTCGDQVWQIEADEEGQLQRLIDDRGELLLEIEERLPPLPASEALEREEAYQDSFRNR